MHRAAGVPARGSPQQLSAHFVIGDFRQNDASAAGRRPRTSSRQPQDRALGGDPRRTPRRVQGTPTFEEAVGTVLAIHSAAWKAGDRTAENRQTTLRQYAYPCLGREGVDRVTTADVMAVRLPIWTRKHATPQKVRQRIGTVMKWQSPKGTGTTTRPATR